MSLYNMLFGENPFADLLLQLLGTTSAEIPRYRDCYLDEEGRIVIHTRTGGGNRDAYEKDGCDAKEYNPKGPYNDDLRKLPGFIYDEDDDFDCTYADFYYKPAPEHAMLITALKDLGGASNPTERWQQLFKDLDSADTEKPEVQRAIKVGKQIMDRIDAAMKDGKGGPA